MNARSITRAAIRQGFTLLELLLVIGILLMMAGLATPSVLRTLSSQSLDKGCEIVRGEMARARVMAIRTGKVHAIVFAPGGNKMLVKDFDSVANDSSLGQQFSNATMENTNNIVQDGTLPKGVWFSAGESIATTRSEFVTDESGQPSGGIRPVLFYPDGTCQDARIVLTNTKGELKQVILRSLTGTTRVVVPSGRR